MAYRSREGLAVILVLGQLTGLTVQSASAAKFRGEVLVQGNWTYKN